MRKLLVAVAAMACALFAAGSANAKTLGIVALLANDALNIDVIGGATEAAKAAGWNVKVIDTQASADKANAAMNTFVVEHVDAIFVLAFASSSIGSGLEAARQAHIPVAMWGGEIVPGVVVATSGRQVGDDSAKFLLSKVGDNADRIKAVQDATGPQKVSFFGRVPADTFMSKRWMPSARTVPAILRATVSAEPTYSEPCSTSSRNSSRPSSDQPRSRPMRARMAL